MNGIEALRLAAYHRVLSIAAAGACLILIAFGLWVGAWDAIATIAADWPRPDPAGVLTLEAAVGGFFVALGIGLWWIVSAAIAYHVHAVVVGAAAAGPRDEQLKSEIRSMVDEHLDRWEADASGSPVVPGETAHHWYRRD